jgi:hypothetical protein
VADNQGEVTEQKGIRRKMNEPVKNMTKSEWIAIDESIAIHE